MHNMVSQKNAKNWFSIPNNAEKLRIRETKNSVKKEIILVYFFQSRMLCKFAEMLKNSQYYKKKINHSFPECNS